MNKKEKRIYFVCGIIIIFLILIGLLFSNYENKDRKEFSDNYVVRIIDGDTFELYSGEKVRLICVDAPEKGRDGYDEAILFLSELILNKEVRLERDVSGVDAYGRLLRYVWVNNSVNEEVFVNRDLVQKGFAEIWAYGNDTSRCGEISG
jgi:micrococcal nuclease